MKRPTVFAASVAAMMLLTACPHKPDDDPEQKLQLIDVTGYYEGTYTVEVQPFGDPTVQTLTYVASGDLKWEYIGGIDSSRSFHLEWHALIADTGRYSFFNGEFQGAVSRFDTRVTAMYPLSTQWGEVTLYPSGGDWTKLTYAYGDVRLEADGEDLTLIYADTVRDYVDTEGVTRALEFRSTCALSKKRAY